MNWLFNKRIKNEASKSDNWTLDFEEKQGLGLVFYGENQKKHMLVNIVFPHSYPFKAPKIKLPDGTSVIRLLRTNSLNKEIEEISGFSCLCCSYLECGDLWGPTMNIDLILKQLGNLLDFKKRALERYFCKKIAIKNNIPVPPYGPAIEDFI